MSCGNQSVDRKFPRRLRSDSLLYFLDSANIAIMKLWLKYSVFGGHTLSILNFTGKKYATHGHMIAVHVVVLCLVDESFLCCQSDGQRDTLWGHLLEET